MDVIHACDTASVRRITERVSAADGVAFDTEFLWERTYFPRLCLVQIATSDLHATVDPLADGIDSAGDALMPLWEALTGGPTVLVHAGEHDLDILHRAVGRCPVRVFDTQVAGAFLGHGDTPGYETLVTRVLRRRLMGGEGYTDWSRRPLTERQVEYALDDVRHLLDLRDRLAEDLEARGRASWVDDEIDRRFESIGSPVDPRARWRRVKDVRKLRGRALAVLREVTAWREEWAIENDMTRQRVVPDRVLIEVARRAPTDPGGIRRMRGLHPGQAKHAADPLAAAVRRALEIPQDEWPRWDRVPPFAKDPRVDVFASMLHAVVRSRSADLDLASRLLATRSDLEETARLLLAGGLDGAEAASVPLLSGWRREAVGEDVLRILRGEAALRVVNGGDGPILGID